MWNKKLSQFVTKLSSPCPSLTAILFSPPCSIPSVHISLYLPTAGKDDEFSEECLKIHFCLLEIREKYPNCPMFLRGDTNCNPKNKKRCEILNKIVTDFHLSYTDINHKTYHHFVGNGSFDSQIDALLHSSEVSEYMLRIHCCLSDPSVTSHHDVLVSRVFLPSSTSEEPTSASEAAPRLANSRVKIDWSDEGKDAYRLCAGPYLKKMRESWLCPSSSNSMSVLLSTTNDFLKYCAMNTNNF